MKLEGLGWLTWREMVALADILIGIVWTDLTLAEQEEIFLSYTYDPLTKPRAENATVMQACDRRPNGSPSELACLFIITESSRSARHPLQFLHGK